MSRPRIAITAGEPAGIGADIIATYAQQNCEGERVVIGCGELLSQRAQQLGLSLNLYPFEHHAPARAQKAGELALVQVDLHRPATAGQLDPANAAYVLATLDAAIDGCHDGQFNAMVTAPVQKSVINEAGIPFSGHTEYLAERTGTERVVMMLATEQLRVALATTHLPLAAVPATITQALLLQTLRIVRRDLNEKWGIAEPCIAVLGLNPHAGENGHLGREELDTIIPAMNHLREQGFDLLGPLPADTAFNPTVLDRADAVFAMYHDQGLPVLKYSGFGNAVNITLGLPIIRTSVDHGTALELAGSGKANIGSLVSAVAIALQMSERKP